MTNLDSMLKSRDITLSTKVHLVKAIVFQVVMYGCESWTIKKAEGQRIDAFELWCLRRLLSPLDCKEFKPVCLFNFHAEYIMWNARLDKSQAGIKIAGRNINNLRYADNTTLMAQSEELKSLLMKVKEER